MSDPTHTTIIPDLIFGSLYRGDIPTNEPMEVGLKLYSRSPSWEGISRTAGGFKSVHELDGLDEWVPVTVGIQSVMGYNPPESGSSYSDPMMYPAPMHIKVHTEAHRISFVPCGLSRATGVFGTAVIPFGSGWRIVQNGSKKQDIVTTAVVYLKGVYAGVRDPILYVSPQGLPVNNVIRVGTLYGMDLTESQFPTYLSNPTPPPLTYSLSSLVGIELGEETNTRVVSSVDVHDQRMTIRTTTPHGYGIGDYVILKPFVGEQYGLLKVVAASDPNEFQVLWNRADPPELTPTDNRVYRRSTSVDGDGISTLTSMPVWQSPTTVHTWFTPQRMNLVANPSFESHVSGSPDMWAGGSTQGAGWVTPPPQLEWMTGVESTHIDTSASISTLGDSLGGLALLPWSNFGVTDPGDGFDGTPLRVVTEVTSIPSLSGGFPNNHFWVGLGLLGGYDVGTDTFATERWIALSVDQFTVYKDNTFDPTYEVLYTTSEEADHLLALLATVSVDTPLRVTIETTGLSFVYEPGTPDFWRASMPNEVTWTISIGDEVLWTFSEPSISDVSGLVPYIRFNTSGEIASFRSEVGVEVQPPDYLSSATLTSIEGGIGVTNTRTRCGRLARNGAEGLLVAESNKFPAVGQWYSISLKASGIGNIRVGTLSWDADGDVCTYVRIDEHELSYQSTTTDERGNPVVETHTQDSASADGPWDFIKVLVPVVPGTTQMALRIEFDGDELWIDDCLVDPNPSQFTYFDGNSNDGLPEDFRWHGGIENKQFSLWYNNWRNTNARLFGSFDETDAVYKQGMLEDWLPDLADVVVHWDAIDGYTPDNWDGDYFYPIVNNRGFDISEVDTDLDVVLNPFGNYLQAETGASISTELPEMLEVEVSSQPTLLMTEDGLLLDVEQFGLTGSPLTT